MKNKKELENILEKALKDLKTYANCAVCRHCDKEKYPLNGYCDIGGCCGHDGATESDEWEYREVQ